MKNTRPTLESIQLLRAIAAWIVVIHHFVQIYGPSSGGWFDQFFLGYGAVGVDVFFVISGFVMYKSTHEKAVSPGSFISNRLVRIVPAYWLYTCLTAILLFAIPGIIPSTAFEPGFFLKSLFFIPANNPTGIGPFPLVTVGWTLNYEMAFYLVFALALFVWSDVRLAAIIIGMYLLQTEIPKISVEATYYANKICNDFVMGLVVGVIYCKNRLKMPLLIAIVLAIGSLWMIGKHPHSHDPNLIGLPCAVLLASVLSQESLFKTPAWMINLGDWSYSTYLCHVIVLCLGHKVMTIFGLNPWLTFIGCCTVIVAVSWVSYTFVEQKATIYLKQKLTRVTSKSRFDKLSDTLQ